MSNIWCRFVEWALPPQPTIGDIYMEEKQPTGVEEYLIKLCKETDNDEV
jgi:hypothetical protein